MIIFNSASHTCFFRPKPDPVLNVFSVSYIFKASWSWSFAFCLINWLYFPLLFWREYSVPFALLYIFNIPLKNALHSLFPILTITKLIKLWRAKQRQILYTFPFGRLIQELSEPSSNGDLNPLPLISFTNTFQIHFKFSDSF